MLNERMAICHAHKTYSLGLNLGFTKDELYPKVGNTYWSQSNGAIDIAKVEDFFENRFNGFYVKHSNGRSRDMLQQQRISLS